MRKLHGRLAWVIALGLGVAGASLCAAQTGATPADSTASAVTPAAGTAATADAAAAPVATAPEKKVYTVPAGTKVLLQLRSAVNTKSAKPGDGVYLASTFPVVVGNRVMIPWAFMCRAWWIGWCIRTAEREGAARHALYVDHLSKRIGGRDSGRGRQPTGGNEADGENDGEGTIQQAGDKGRNAGKAAEIAIPTGAGWARLEGQRKGTRFPADLPGWARGWRRLGWCRCLRATPMWIYSAGRRWRWCCNGR